MKASKKIGIAAAVVAVAGVVLAFTPWGGQVLFLAFITFNKPAGEFNPEDAAPAPDYSQEVNWAALPTRSDLADIAPRGVKVEPQGDHPVDVFFIHPTGFLTSGSWTSPMDPNSGTEENTQWMMANQASAYNGCCNIYAPRYREANIFAYFGSIELRDTILGFAYQDVKRAFEYYLQHNNQGKPFIIASHSQGSHHAKRLLKEVVDSSDLHQQMVAAYLIGSTIVPLSQAWLDSMDHITACESATDLHCVVGWDTMPEGSAAMDRDADSLCTNPLSWRVDEELADAGLNLGAVLAVGSFNTTFGRQTDQPLHPDFKQPDEPIQAKTWAQCRQGSLFAGKDLGEGFSPDDLGTYHIVDYALFYMNIHHNAKLRANNFISR